MSLLWSMLIIIEAGWLLSASVGANIDAINGKLISSLSDESFSDESMSDSNDNSNDDKITTTTTSPLSSSTLPPLILQPNVADAIKVPGEGLLVPLVIPAVATTNITNSSAINNNPLLINSSPNEDDNNNTLESSEDNANIMLGETKKRQVDTDDLEVAEDIVFRPLFRYRQEQASRRRLQRPRYYQPYIYARRYNPYN